MRRLCFSDAPSSDTSSYELEQPPLLRATAADHTVSGSNDDPSSRAAGGVADIEGQPLTSRFVSSSKLADEVSVTDATKPPVCDENRSDFMDEVPSTTGREGDWVDQSTNAADHHHTSSHMSLLSADT